MTEEPVIWKKTDCLAGECKGTHTKHWWSVPTCVPAGLATECYHCNKSRFIEVDN